MKTILKATILALTSFSGMESPMVAASLIANQSSSTDTTLMANPMLWADVPDPDVIRVGHTFYMVSTTMHLMPGAPIMQSPDLVSWTTAGYIFNKLTDSPRYNLHQGTVGLWYRGCVIFTMPRSSSMTMIKFMLSTAPGRCANLPPTSSR